MTTRDRPLTARERRRQQQVPAPRRRILSRRLGPLPVWAILASAVGVIAIVAIAAVNSLSGIRTGPGVRYDVGKPGVGQMAPEFELARATSGPLAGPFKLSAQRGKSVLLYFHEGLMCAPCWQQIDEIQADLPKFKALGIDQVAAISIDPAAAQQQRAELHGISVSVLADVDLAVSAEYDALRYGMMGGDRPGHTFILVGPDGVIRWRADYGGPPDFTMHVPDATLLAELQKVLGGA